MERCDALECKWTADAFEPRSLLAMREHRPAGRNFVVCANVATPYTRTIAGLTLRFLSAQHLEGELTSATMASE